MSVVDCGSGRRYAVLAEDQVGQPLLGPSAAVAAVEQNRVWRGLGWAAAWRVSGLAFVAVTAQQMM